MSTTVQCPRCNQYVEIDSQDREHYEGYEEYSCPECDEIFEVYAEPTIHYSSCEKAPCLNGEDHKWKQIVGCPEIHFRGKYRCETCSAEKTVQEELVTKEEADEYFK